MNLQNMPVCKGFCREIDVDHLQHKLEELGKTEGVTELRVGAAAAGAPTDVEENQPVRCPSWGGELGAGKPEPAVETTLPFRCGR